MSGLFKGQEFKSLESISLGGSCLLRRVFTLRSTSEDVPRACQMPPAVGTVETQVLGFEELTSTQSSSSPERGKGDSSEAPPPSAMATRPPTHVAFGSKVAIPDHVIQARKGSGGSSRSGANQGQVDDKLAVCLMVMCVGRREGRVGGVACLCWQPGGATPPLRAAGGPRPTAHPEEEDQGHQVRTPHRRQAV